MQFELPSSVYTTRHVELCLDRASNLEQLFQTQRIRKLVNGTESDKTVLVPTLLADFLHQNSLEVNEPTIKRVRLYFEKVRGQAPVLSLTLTTAPNDDTAHQLIVWFRQNIHPLVLLRLHFKPAMLGGFILHTSEHVYDRSIRSQLEASGASLSELLRSHV